MSDNKPRFTMENYLGAPDPNHVKKCMEAQSKLCSEKKYPHFAPHDGRCYNCSRQIYDRITLCRAETDLITGCPWCNRSYCE